MTVVSPGKYCGGRMRWGLMRGRSWLRGPTWRMMSLDRLFLLPFMTWQLTCRGWRLRPVMEIDPLMRRITKVVDWVRQLAMRIGGSFGVE